MGGDARRGGPAAPAQAAPLTWKVESFERVALVTMRGTPANAQGEDFYAALHGTLDHLDEEYRDHAVVLTADGSVFSAGLDLPYVAGMFARADLHELRAWQLRYFETNLRLFAFERPLIAAINGHAFAGGLITALCADYRVTAGGPTRFALNEVPIGIPMPTTYLELIAHATGWAAAARLSLFGEEFDAETALRLNVVDEIVDDEALITRAVAIAERIPATSMPAFVGTKRALRAPVLGRMRSAAYATDAGVLSVLSTPASQKAMASRLAHLGSIAR